MGLVLAGAWPSAGQPAPPVRIVAEWEPAVGTLITWPLGIPQALVVELAQDDRLYVLTRSAGDEAQATSTFAAWGVDLNQVEYIRCAHDTHWTRDWGPHQIFDGAGEWAIVDPVFRGYPWVDTPCGPITSPGGYVNDDSANSTVATYFGAPLYSLGAFLTGGNFLVDGQAAAFSTCAMIGENQQLWSEAQFRERIADYLGVTAYHVVNNTENHGIQHIDCWFKLLDEETLLVKRPPVWHEEYDRIEENLAQLAGLTNTYGRPYTILRIDCPPYDGYNVANYTNALILNRKVLVPLFGIAGDAEALQTWAAAMPGYEIVGFPWGSWYYYDALHCRVRAVFDRHMLRMTHRRLDAVVAPAAEFVVTAFIDDRSETGLIADALRVHWRVSGAGVWESAPLTPSGPPDVYAGAIPGQPAGTVIEYYLAAADNSGRAETLPRSAPAGFYRFTVGEIGLSIAVPDPPTLLAPWSLTEFEVTIDPAGEALVPGSALLHYRYDGGPYQARPLDALGGQTYRAVLPRALCGDLPEFYVSAEGSASGVKTAPANAPAERYTAVVGQFEAVSLLAESFEGGLPAGWSATGLWHVSTACPVNPPCAGPRWAYYGRDATCTYNNGGRNSGTLSTPPIALPLLPPGGVALLTYCSNLETENEPGYDVAGVYVDEALVDVPAQSAAWQARTVDLSAFAGQTVRLKWWFDTIDDYYNNFHGWQVDGVTLTATALGCALAPPLLPGDLNCDGAVGFGDINAFVLALSAPDAWAAQYPGCPVANGDFDSDGACGFGDINPFVARLAGGP